MNRAPRSSDPPSRRAQVPARISPKGRKETCAILHRPVNYEPAPDVFRDASPKSIKSSFVLSRSTERKSYISKNNEPVVTPHDTLELSTDEISRLFRYSLLFRQVPVARDRLTVSRRPSARLLLQNRPIATVIARAVAVAAAQVGSRERRESQARAVDYEETVGRRRGYDTETRPAVGEIASERLA